MPENRPLPEVARTTTMGGAARITVSPEGVTYYDAHGSVVEHTPFTGPTSTAPAEVWASHIPAQPDGVDAVVPLDAPQRVYRLVRDEFEGDLWRDDLFSSGMPWDELLRMWVRGVRRYEPPPPRPCDLCDPSVRPDGGGPGDFCPEHLAEFTAWRARKYPDG